MFEEVFCIRFAPKGGHVIDSVVKEESFAEESSEAECSAVECEPTDNGSRRSDRLVNQNQVRHSRRGDARSPAGNGASYY
jgi:hypothetical protein